MNFNEFKAEVAEKIIDQLSEVEGLRAEVKDVLKNNDQRKTGLILTAGKENVAPVIYLEDFYAELQHGRPFADVLKDIRDIYREHAHMPVAAEDILNVDMRDKVFAVLVDKARNAENLENLVYKDVGSGLALTYRVQVTEVMPDGGQGTVGVSKSMAMTRGLDVNTIHEMAIDSLRRDPIEFRPMEEIMNEFLQGVSANSVEFNENMEVNKDEVMFVLSNQSRFYGASLFFYPGVKETIEKILGEGYFVLPSSKHELIIIPESRGVSPEELSNMVKEVNESQVDSVDQISDTAYFYDPKIKELMPVAEMDVQKVPEIDSPQMTM